MSWAFLCAPAKAQFAAPFGGGPGVLTAPEAASGAIGAGAAQSARTQQQCTQMATGRDGPRGLCLPNAAPPEPRRR
jgi:hypothetical protein